MANLQVDDKKPPLYRREFGTIAGEQRLNGERTEQEATEEAEREFKTVD